MQYRERSKLVEIDRVQQLNAKQYRLTTTQYKGQEAGEVKLIREGWLPGAKPHWGSYAPEVWIRLTN